MMYFRRHRLRSLLYLICALTDFAAFVVVFTISRGLAEDQASAMFLGILGAGLALSAAIGSIGSGWLAHKLDVRRVFLSGAILIVFGITACACIQRATPLFIASYWTVGIGLGLLYPPLIGWLNQDEDAHANRRGVSRVLIIYCIAWNTGMMFGQLAGGSLFALGPNWSYASAILIAVLTLALAVVAAGQVRPCSDEKEDPTDLRRSKMELASAFKRLSWMANIGGTFGGSMVIHLLPDLAVQIGVPPDSHGLLLAVFRLVVIVTYLLMHAITFWHYNLLTAIASQAIGAGGLILIAQANSASMLMVGMALLGQLIGYNYFSGLFYSTAGSAKEGRTMAAGIHEATLAGGMAVGTLIGGVLGTFVSVRSPYWLAATCVLILIALQTTAWRIWVLPLRRQAQVVRT